MTWAGPAGKPVLGSGSNVMGENAPFEFSLSDAFGTIISYAFTLQTFS
jgi:hypothetical protein